MNNFEFFKDRAKHYMKMFEIDHLWDVSFEELDWDNIAPDFDEQVGAPAFAVATYSMESKTLRPHREAVIVYNSDDTLNEMLVDQDIDYLAMHEVLHRVFAGVFYPDIDKEHKIIDALMYGMSMPIEEICEKRAISRANGIMQTIWINVMGIVQKVDYQRN